MIYLVLVTYGPYAQGQGPPVGADIEGHGSVPPVKEWYFCVRQLSVQPTYDPTEGEKCLKQILSHRYFKSGRIKVDASDPQSKLVIFVLESPKLSLTKIDYGISRESRSEFEQYVATNNEFPRLGDTYDNLAEGGNEERIQNLFASKGMRVRVSKKVSLDYRNHTAELAYKVWEGPRGPKRPLAPDCEILVTGFSLLDLDDFTPRSLILNSTQTKERTCYSESMIRTDEQTLKGMGIFADAHYSIQGTGDTRGVLIHVRTRPLMIGSVSINGFGLTSSLEIQKESDDIPKLPLKSGATYSLRDGAVSVKLLESYFRTDIARADVFEDDELQSDSTLKVTFDVLTWPKDGLYIDGRQMEP